MNADSAPQGNTAWSLIRTERIGLVSKKKLKLFFERSTFPPKVQAKGAGTKGDGWGFGRGEHAWHGAAPWAQEDRDRGHREGKCEFQKLQSPGSSLQGESWRPYGFNLWRAERPAIFHFHLCFLLPNSWNFLNLVS